MLGQKKKQISYLGNKKNKCSTLGDKYISSQIKHYLPSKNKMESEKEKYSIEKK